MKKVFPIFLFLVLAIAYRAGAQRYFRFAPLYNYDTDYLEKRLKITKTDTEKLNLLYSLAFQNNTFARTPTDIDTGYLNQIIRINQSSKLFDDKPFRTLSLALREGAQNKFQAELAMLKTAVEEFDRQNTEIASLLIMMRWIFNIAGKQEDKLQFYSKQLGYYLQAGQYHNAAACYHCLAGYYTFKGDFNSSINQYLKAGELFKSFSKFWYVQEFTNVGGRYNEWGNPVKGLFYLEKALKLGASLGISNIQSDAFTYLPDVEYNLKHYLASLSYIDRLNHFKDYEGKADIDALKALDYIALNRLPEAYKVLNDMEKIPARSRLTHLIQDQKYSPEYAFYKYYMALKDFAKAEGYLVRAFRSANSEANVNLKIKFLRELEQFYGDRDNAAKAREYMILYNRANDSVENSTAGFKVASYENEQKENAQNKKLAILQQQRAVQNAVIGQRNTIIWVSMIGLFAVLGSLIFIYRQLLINRRNLSHLKSTQTQLIQSEKMASLGELTAGIAHEIQNPLNFVNNFSEVSAELLGELKDELDKGEVEEAKLITNDVIQNLEKINHHGKRADAIVKGMLQHSRTGGGEKQPANINTLADEFLRLSYHGLRAKDKEFNAELVTHFDPDLPKINVIGQDIGRVLLNLFNNAFYAVNQKQKTAGADYKPTVEVSTELAPPSGSGGLIIKVKDNGVGMPDHIKEKIMQPFFTTKPTGEGTGLGLSLTYDMVVKGHGGTIQVNSVEGEGSEFIIQLPIK